MAEGRSGAQLTALLWFIAGALAWIAVGIRYARSREISWALAAAGLACLMLGLSARTRARRDASPSSGPHRDPPV